MIVRSGRAARAAAVALLAPILAPARVAGQVTVLRPLAFGTIITGTTTTVAATSASAAAWRIHGTVAVTGGITLALPTALTRIGGGATMPVTFCSTCGVYRVNSTVPSGGTTFDPATGIRGLSVSVISDVYVWLGAAVNPPLGQAPGSYSGTIVLTLAPIL